MPGPGIQTLIPAQNQRKITRFATFGEAEQARERNFSPKTRLGATQLSSASKSAAGWRRIHINATDPWHPGRHQGIHEINQSRPVPSPNPWKGPARTFSNSATLFAQSVPEIGFRGCIIDDADGVRARVCARARARVHARAHAHAPALA